MMGSLYLSTQLQEQKTLKTSLVLSQSRNKDKQVSVASRKLILPLAREYNCCSSSTSWGLLRQKSTAWTIGIMGADDEFCEVLLDRPLCKHGTFCDSEASAIAVFSNPPAAR